MHVLHAAHSHAPPMPNLQHTPNPDDELIEPRDAWTMAADGLPPDFKASMLQSLEKGSATEIDFINGAVVRAGARCGVPTPVNEALVACIKGIERGLPQQPAAGSQ